MIDGVRIKELKVHRDVPDRKEDIGTPGFLVEVVRDDDGLLERFGQSTFTVTYPGTIKAFHYHEHQDDLWFVASGKALVVLHDLRKDSPTFGKTQVLEAGTDEYKLIFIPIGVAHGFKALGNDPVLLFYHTTRSYDPAHPDEKRMPFDDPTINFDWARGVPRGEHT